MLADERAAIWSYGGGVQSVALLALIYRGRLPQPERVVMADTGRERQAVWDYADEVVRPVMARLGMTLEVVPHEYAAVDLMGTQGDLLLPVFTRNGKDGKLPTFCSTEWKQRPVRRYLREQGYGPERPVQMWFGMSLDEVGRMRTADVQWIENYYPLCQDASVRMRRHECELLIAETGWPAPPKSACWMCPNRDDATWQEMKDNEPEDFAKAVRLERVLRGAGWGEIALHRQRVPLDEVDFSAGDSTQPGLFDECAFSCWT